MFPASVPAEFYIHAKLAGLFEFILVYCSRFMRTAELIFPQKSALILPNVNAP